ncbi:hypothetical protein [Curtobacterium sp. VKM Ac-2887]|uniref:hypothetical protein n=1 Tax=Curtobacterium sp. VKM Ac-2887 TaxID=2783819 RepID=UPI00188C8633|nr:hypothetical protein [Curtobacterium sp. VKM Ac-2887]MBF4587241.1 hypothetical protein [Curtobacterium sp. VKM Ac-2887]
MQTHVRPLVATAAAAALVAILTGCAAASPAGPATSTPDRVGASTSTSPTPTETTTPSPTATATAPSPTATATPTVSALAQHIHDECNKGADDAGVVLEFTAEPSGYTSDGKYLLVYPIKQFTDGHTDPWAIYNCTLTDATVGSTFVGGGVTDTH